MRMEISVRSFPSKTTAGDEALTTLMPAALPAGALFLSRPRSKPPLSCVDISGVNRSTMSRFPRLRTLVPFGGSGNSGGPDHAEFVFQRLSPRASVYAASAPIRWPCCAPPYNRWTRRVLALSLER